MVGMGHGPPLARDHGVLYREVPDGLMVYDQERDTAHTLNRAAALVWRHCDGKTSASEMATLLQQEFNLPADEAVVWLALDRLEKAHLLQNHVSRSAETAGVSRRAVIRKLGLAGGLAALLPLVDSLAAPAPASAASGGTSCLPNGEGSQCTAATAYLCCSGRCNTNAAHPHCVG